jgi:hypothetical protein
MNYTVGEMEEVHLMQERVSSRSERAGRVVDGSMTELGVGAKSNREKKISQGLSGKRDDRSGFGGLRVFVGVLGAGKG